MAVAVAVPAAAACVLFSYICHAYLLVYVMVKLVKPSLCRRLRVARLQAAQQPVNTVEQVVEPAPVKKPSKAKSKS